MEVGIIGLGRMGFNMAKRLLNDGHRVYTYNRNSKKTDEIVSFGAVGIYELKEFEEKMESPRVIFLMLPAGRITDEYVEKLTYVLKSGDMAVDGGNGNFEDDTVRSELLNSKGIKYMDAGVSGGVWGLKNGYCMMLGGNKNDYCRIIPILDSLSAENGHMYCGGTGAGHFVKMVHNGIEYAMMQSYAEGFELLKASEYGGEIDLSKLSKLWNNGSVIKSWLLELIGDAFEENPNLEDISGYVEDSGEARWMVKSAVDLGVSLPVISQSLFRRFDSRQHDMFSNKVLAAMRNKFGGHAVFRSGENTESIPVPKSKAGAGGIKPARADENAGK